MWAGWTKAHTSFVIIGTLKGGEEVRRGMDGGETDWLT